jgi:hypothetical protein
MDSNQKRWRGICNIDFPDSEFAGGASGWKLKDFKRPNGPSKINRVPFKHKTIQSCPWVIYKGSIA